MIAVYIVRFFSNFALAAFYPFLSVWLLESTDMSAFKISIIVSIGIFMSRAGAIFLSTYVNKHDKRKSIWISIALLMLIVLAMAISNIIGAGSLFLWIPLSILWGVFVSVLTLAALAFIADRTSGQKQKDAFSYINISVNLSSGLGPATGAVMLAYNPILLPIIPIIALAIAIIFSMGIPPDKAEHKNTAKRKTKFNRAFVLLCFINFLTFMSYSQFFNIFPVYSNHFIDKKTIGLLFFISSIVITFTQMPMNKILKKMDAYKAVIIANLLSALGAILLISVESHALISCVMAVILISIAQVIYVPVYQTFAVKLFEGSSTYGLALLTLAWGLGEGFTVILGMHLIDQNIGYLSYWIGGIATLITIPVILASKNLLKMTGDQHL